MTDHSQPSKAVPAEALSSPGNASGFRQHDLKTWPEFFSDLLSDRKSFELRKNDRGFRVGDELRLHEYDPDTKIFSGRVLIRKVTYMLEHRPDAGCAATFGLQPEYVILGIAVPAQRPASAESIARTICLSYGRDPEELSDPLEMCDAHNRPVSLWRVYEEQAEAILAAYAVSSTERHCEFCHVPMSSADCCDSEFESKGCPHSSPERS